MPPMALLLTRHPTCLAPQTGYVSFIEESGDVSGML